MKRFLITLMLTMGVMAFSFGQKLTYQSVIRDNAQQLVTNTAVTAQLTIHFADGGAYDTTALATTDASGLLSVEMDNPIFYIKDWKDATLSAVVSNTNTLSVVYLNEESRLLAAVPYALTVNGNSIQNYLDDNHFLTLEQVQAEIRDTANVLRTQIATAGQVSNCTDVVNCVTNELSLDSTALNRAVDTIVGNGLRNYLDTAAHFGNSINNFLDSASSFVNSVENIVDSSSAIQNRIEQQLMDTLANRYNAQALCDSVSTCIASTVNNIIDSSSHISNRISNYLDTAAHFSQTVNNIIDSSAHVGNRINQYLQSDARFVNTLNQYFGSNNHYVNSVENIVDSSTSIHNQIGSQVLDTLASHYSSQAMCDSVSDCIQNAVNNIIDTSSHLTNRISDYLTTNDYVTSDTLDNRHYLTSDSTIITTMQHDIEELTSGTTGNITTANLCSELTSLCTNVVMKNANNTMTGTNTLSGDNTFGSSSDTTTFTSAVTVPSGFSMDTTTAANCAGLAVNACDLAAIFDSIQRRYNVMKEDLEKLQDTLRKLKAAEIPAFLSKVIEKSSSKIDLTTSFSDGGATITDYNFCISQDENMADPTCHQSVDSTYTFTAAPATQYYLQATATNLKGTGNSPIFAVKTPANMPTAGTPTLTPTDTAGFIINIPAITTGGADSAQVRVCYAQGDDCSASLTYTCTPVEDVTAGTFKDTIVHLQPNKKYCVKAEISTNGGDSTITVGPNNVQTPSIAPTLGTPTYTPANNSIAVSVEVTDNGGADITSATICAYKTPQHTDTPKCAEDVDVSSSTIKDTIFGLDPNTQYYVVTTVKNDNKTAKDSADVKTLAGVPALADAVDTTSTNKTIKVEGTLNDMGGTSSVKVKVCAYKNADYSDTPKCSADTTMTSTGDFTRTVTGLDTNTRYHLLVISDNDVLKDTVKATATTTNVQLALTPDTTGTFYTCGATKTITYTATITGDDANLGDYTYAWSVAGTDSTATTNTLTVNYPNATANYKVKCVATRNTDFTFADSVTTKLSKDMIPSMVFCSDCEDGKIYIKAATNVDSATWLNASKVKVYDYKAVNSYALPTGTYSVVATNNTSKCSVTYTGITIDRTPTSCTVSGLNSNESGTTTKLDSVQDHQGNWYRVVETGTGANKQCWLAENMRCTTSPKGYLTDGGSTTSNHKAYYYNNSSDTMFSLRERGYLYNWAGALDTNGTSNIAASFTEHRGICPEGWHIPTDGEWKTLEGGYLTETDGTTGITSSTLDSTEYRGKDAGKFTGGCAWNDSNSSGTYPNNYSYAERNSTGFSALPAGYYNGSFQGAGCYARFWSSTPDSSSYAWSRTFYYRSEGVYRRNNGRYYAFSVRCLRDNAGITLGDITKTDSTTTTLTISAAYTATQTVTGATICAYTDAAGTTAAGTCATPASLSSSPLTGTITGLTANTQYYVKVTATTAGGTASKMAGPFGTKAVVDTITFVANGGSGTMDKQTVTRGTATAINTNTYTHTGNWQFLGWNDARDGNGTNYTDGANITTNGNVTLYAKWLTWCTGTPETNELGTARIDSVKDHENNWYKVVEIGTQCWLAENLRTTHYSDGTSFPQGYGSSTTDSYWYYPDADSSKKATYGLLYNWPAIMHGASSSYTNPSGVQGICPTGWHVPSNAEWLQMLNYVSSQRAYHCGSDTSYAIYKTAYVYNGTVPYIAKALASSTGWYSFTDYCAVGNDSSSNNTTGFSAMPAGFSDGEHYGEITYRAYYWCTSGDYRPSVTYLQGDLPTVSRDALGKNFGLSVRCLRNEEGGGSTTSVPAVSTTTITDITQTTASSGGNVTFDGGATVTARGVCWSTSPNPTVSDSHTTDGTGTGTFTSSLTGLTANTTYYVRAYATNSVGTSYGSQVSFITTLSDGQPCPKAATVTDYDDNTYNTVQIGYQCWMKENLKTTHYSDGNSIPQGNQSSDTNGYWYYPNNDSSNKATYGLLYNWPAVMRNALSSSSNPSGVQGICPTGWHVPSDAEWTQLTDYVSSQSAYLCNGIASNIAKALASNTSWNNSTEPCAIGNDTNTNNATGFSAVPAGISPLNHSYFGNWSKFHSATQFNNIDVFSYKFSYDRPNVSRLDYESKSESMSVRCLRDNSGITLGAISKTDSTTTTLSISAEYSGDSTVTFATICAYTDSNCTVAAGTCAADVTFASSPITGTITGLTAGTRYYIKVTANAVGSITSKIAGPFETVAIIDTITFMPNGGSGTMTKQTVKHNSTTAIKTNNFTHTGNWQFLGWNNSCDGTGIDWADGGNIFIDGNDTLYAQWHTWCTGAPATNELGTARIDSVKDHQDNWYKVVEIGGQCIMKQNLRATTSPAGNALSSTWDVSTNKSCYIQNTTFGNEGYLYNWRAALDTTIDVRTIGIDVDIPNRRGLCPQGWHLPTRSEWTSLVGSLDAGQFAAPNGSYTGTDWMSSSSANTPGYTSDPNRNATGFSGVPVGSCTTAPLTSFGQFAYFWSATSLYSDYAYYRVLKTTDSSFADDSYAKMIGNSIRCIRDNSGLTLGAITKTDSTSTTLSISADYTATQTVTSATICAYTDAACTTPAGTCAADVTFASSPITGTVTGLTAGTQYYVKVTATTAGGSKSAVAGPFWTKAPTMNITSNPTSAKVCSGDSVQITFTATLNGATASSYSWNVTGGTGSSTTNTITVTATEAGTINVSCTAAGLTATASTTVTAGTVPTLGLCEECFNDSIQVKVKTNVASILWRNSLNDSISNSLTGLKKSATIPAGIYTAIAKSSDGCSVSRSAVLGNYVAHPCTVTAKHSNELGSTATTIDSVKDHQNNWYKVVQIGEGANAQCWLAENMRATTSPSTHSTIVFGDASAYVQSYSSKCAINHNDSKYGVLYNWCAAVDTFDANSSRPELANAPGHSSSSWSVTMPSGNRRGICPEGWHIPTDAEWTSMASLAGVGQDSGTGVSKLSGGCDWSSQSSGTYPGSYSVADSNSTGFSALPAGYCNSSSIGDLGTCAYFWSVTPCSSAEAYNRYLYKESQFVRRYLYYRNYAFSVRCLRDNSGITLGAISKTDSTTNTLSISAAYSGDSTITSATICAYTDAACTLAAGTCATPASLSSSPITGTITGLTAGTQYYVKVTATTNGGSESAVAGPFGTKAVTLSISSNRTDTISRCGSLDTTVTYSATVTGITSPTYAWKVNGTDSTAVTSNTLTVHYTTSATNKVVCTVNGVSDTAQTVTKVGVVPTLLVCEECPEGSITVKTKTDVASIVWRNSSNDSVSNSTTALTLSASIPAGTYTATAKSSDGCTVSRTAVLREQNAVPHPCTVLSLRGNESGAGTRLDSVKDHQDNWYKVVQIGTQCWLAENMRATTSPKGLLVSGGTSGTDYNNLLLSDKN